MVKTMSEFLINKLAYDAFEVTLNTHCLDLGNNYNLTHFEEALVEALGEHREDLYDLLYNLDAPEHTHLYFKYKGSFNWHTDTISLSHACTLLEV